MSKVEAGEKEKQRGEGQSQCIYQGIRQPSERRVINTHMCALDEAHGCPNVTQYVATLKPATAGFRI